MSTLVNFEENQSQWFRI